MQKFPLKKGLSSAQDLHNEINEYIDVLMGHFTTDRNGNIQYDAFVKYIFDIGPPKLAR